MAFDAMAARRPKKTRANSSSAKAQGKKVAQGNPPPAKPPRAPRTRARSARKAPPSSFALSLTPAQQEQLAGGALVLIAALTLLGAFNLSGGNILDGWTRILSVLFGWGRLLAPFFFGGLGAWLLLDSMDMRPDIGWERPLALIILFFVIETSMQVAQIGQGGGLVGHALYDVLVGGLGLVGALLVLFVLLAIGLILLFNISVPQIIKAVSDALGTAQASVTDRTRSIKITRGGRERIPQEMITAPPRET